MYYITNMVVRELGNFPTVRKLDRGRTRPLIERTYRVVLVKDGTFVVEIAITETWPTTTARAFATEAEAEAWIARHGGNSPVDMLTPFSANP
jgi:hypothetical protein